MALRADERLAFNCPSPSGRTLQASVMDAAPPPGATLANANLAQAAQRDTLAFRALLAFMFLLLFRPQDELPFLSPLHLAEIAGTIALLATVIGRLSRGTSPTRITPEVIGVLLFAGLIVGMVPFSFWPGGSMQLFTDQFVKIVVVFIVIINTLTTRERIERFVTLVVAGATYVGTRAILDYARGVNLVEDGRVAGAVGGLFGNPNDMALNMVTFLPLGIGLALNHGRPKMRLVGMLSIPAMSAAIIFSKSRGGTVGLIAMGLVLLWYMRRLRPSVAVAILAASVLALPLLPASFTDRMASIFDAEQDPTGSREARKTLLKEGWNIFLANPLMGIGPGQFPNYSPDSRQEAWRQTHNAPLQVAAEMGIVGLVVFGFLIWTGFSAVTTSMRTLRRALGLRSRDPAMPRRAGAPLNDAEWLQLTAAMVAASMAGWFVAAMFASVAYYWTLYLILGLAAAIRDVSTEVVTPAPVLEGRAKNRRAA